MKNKSLSDVLSLVEKILNEFNRKKALNILDADCHKPLADAYRNVTNIALKGVFYHTKEEKDSLNEAKNSLLKCQQHLSEENII